MRAVARVVLLLVLTAGLFGALIYVLFSPNVHEPWRQRLTIALPTLISVSAAGLFTPIAARTRHNASASARTITALTWDYSRFARGGHEEDAVLPAGITVLASRHPSCLKAAAAPLVRSAGHRGWDVIVSTAAELAAYRWTPERIWSSRAGAPKGHRPGDKLPTAPKMLVVEAITASQLHSEDRARSELGSWCADWPTSRILLLTVEDIEYATHSHYLQRNARPSTPLSRQEGELHGADGQASQRDLSCIRRTEPKSATPTDCSLHCCVPANDDDARKLGLHIEGVSGPAGQHTSITDTLILALRRLSGGTADLYDLPFLANPGWRSAGRMTTSFLSASLWSAPFAVAGWAAASVLTKQPIALAGHILLAITTLCALFTILIRITWPTQRHSSGLSVAEAADFLLMFAVTTIIVNDTSGIAFYWQKEGFSYSYYLNSGVSASVAIFGCVLMRLGAQPVRWLFQNHRELLKTFIVWCMWIVTTQDLSWSVFVTLATIGAWKHSRKSRGSIAIACAAGILAVALFAGWDSRLVAFSFGQSSTTPWIRQVIDQLPSWCICLIAMLTTLELIYPLTGGFFGRRWTRVSIEVILGAIIIAIAFPDVSVYSSQLGEMLTLAPWILVISGIPSQKDLRGHDKHTHYVVTASMIFLLGCATLLPGMCYWVQQTHWIPYMTEGYDPYVGLPLSPSSDPLWSYSLLAQLLMIGILVACLARRLMTSTQFRETAASVTLALSVRLTIAFVASIVYSLVLLVVLDIYRALTIPAFLFPESSDPARNLAGGPVGDVAVVVVPLSICYILAIILLAVAWLALRYLPWGGVTKGERAYRELVGRGSGLVRRWPLFKIMFGFAVSGAIAFELFIESSSLTMTALVNNWASISLLGACILVFLYIVDFRYGWEELAPFALLLLLLLLLQGRFPFYILLPMIALGGPRQALARRAGKPDAKTLVVTMIVVACLLVATPIFNMLAQGSSDVLFDVLVLGAPAIVCTALVRRLVYVRTLSEHVRDLDSIWRVNRIFAVAFGVFSATRFVLSIAPSSFGAFPRYQQVIVVVALIMCSLPVLALGASLGAMWTNAGRTTWARLSGLRASEDRGVTATQVVRALEESGLCTISGWSVIGSGEVAESP